MTETELADRDIVIDLHNQFVIANTHEDTDFLAPHLYPDVSWYNLNTSNYMSDEAILRLWRWLHEQRPDKTRDAPIRAFNEQVFVDGNVAWIVYMIEVEYDFGAVKPKRLQAARCTEIWQKQDGNWRLRHFHCSEHQPGVMGGE
jgi:ketosteroid isomerase-like protein